MIRSVRVGRYDHRERVSIGQVIVLVSKVVCSIGFWRFRLDFRLGPAAD